MPQPIDCEYVGGPADGHVCRTFVDPTGQPAAWRVVWDPGASGDSATGAVAHRYDAECDDDGRWSYRWRGLLRSEPMR